MKTKEEIVNNWLRRFMYKPIDSFGKTALSDFLKEIKKQGYK
jgi:hypothetical protein